MKKEKYKVIGFYDTETCNIGVGVDTKAYPILYIFNYIKDDIENYKVGASDNIIFMRNINEVISNIKAVCDNCFKYNFVGVIGVYNLLFDIQPIIYELCKYFKVETLAKNSTSPYFIDIYMQGKKVLRFWDMFYLDMRGLAALGSACGLKKLIGEWDYALIRTNETPLTDKELEYASRDVQVLPQYLVWVLRNNKDISADMLGNVVLTKTGIVRLNAKCNIGKIKSGKKTLSQIFRTICKCNAPIDYNTYVLRKNCNRGGYTFTAGNNAFKIWSNVTSLDVTSMHHAFINGSKIPYDFKVDNILNDYFYFKVINTTVENIVENYENPFRCAFNACFIFENIRLKNNTIFKKECIATLAESRFKNRKEITNEIQDECINGKFAFSKLLKADKVKLCLTEFELWITSQAYEWDNKNICNCICMEYTENLKNPPEYISLQSNMLFNQKNICKSVLHGNYSYEDVSFLPQTFIEQLNNNNLDKDEFNTYYVNVVKGMFNGIYGTQVMDACKPEYEIIYGNLTVKEDSKVTEFNYKYLDIDWTKIFYTYGSRIVGRSRMHLIIAIILLDKYFNSRVKILAGDTDSLKIACDDDVKDNEIMNALNLLHIGVTNALNTVQSKNRKNYPEIASDLKNVGCFEIETDENNRYYKHIEYWNKARLSITKNGEVHLTFAGLPNKKNNKYRIENIIKKFYEQKGINVAVEILGFNTDIDYEISTTLEHKIPNASEKMNETITDYLGNKSLVTEYQTIALYPVNRVIGSTAANVNRENVEYLQSIDRDINIKNKMLYIDKKRNKAVLALCDGTELFSVDL